MKLLLLWILVVFSFAKTDRSVFFVVARLMFGGRKFMIFKLFINFCVLWLMNLINLWIIVCLVLIGIFIVMLKSRYVKLSFSAINRLFGCGSVCMNLEFSNWWRDVCKFWLRIFFGVIFCDCISDMFVKCKFCIYFMVSIVGVFRKSTTRGAYIKFASLILVLLFVVYIFWNCL